MATINVCDVCGTRHNVSRISLLILPDSDTESTYKTYDLCTRHHLHVIKVTLDNIAEQHGISKYKVNREIVAEIERVTENVNKTRTKPSNSQE